MTRIRINQFSRLRAELLSSLQRTLEAVAEIIEGRELNGVAIECREENEIRITSGPALVFFRAAFGVEDLAFVQYGHFVLHPNGNTRHQVDGEWKIRFDSKYPQALAEERRGKDLVWGALGDVLDSIAKKPSDVRIVDGIVQPKHTLAAKDGGG